MSLKVDRKNPPTKGDKPMPEPVRPCEPADKPEQTRKQPTLECGQ